MFEHMHVQITFKSTCFVADGTFVVAILLMDVLMSHQCVQCRKYFRTGRAPHSCVLSFVMIVHDDELKSRITTREKSNSLPSLKGSVRSTSRVNSAKGERNIPKESFVSGTRIGRK